MVSDLVATFEKYADEYLKFDRETNKHSHRADLHAFILLDGLLPDSRDIVGGAEHDEIFLDVDLEALAKIATEEDICSLVRAGVRYSTEYDCLCMFV